MKKEENYELNELNEKIKENTEKEIILKKELEEKRTLEEKKMELKKQKEKIKSLNIKVNPKWWRKLKFW